MTQLAENNDTIAKSSISVEGLTIDFTIGGGFLNVMFCALWTALALL